MSERQGVDHGARPSNPANFYAAFDPAGRHFDVRYLAGGGHPACTKAELTAAKAAGVDICFVFETAEGSRRAMSGSSAGAADAAIVVAALEALGLTSAQPVYYSCDGIDDRYDSAATVAQYFDGIASVVSVSAIGCYGGYDLLDYLLNHSKITYAWQAYWMSNAGQDPASVLAAAHMKQDTTTVSVGGIICDQDTAYTENFGQIGATAAANSSTSGKYVDARDAWVTSTSPLLVLVAGADTPSPAEAAAGATFTVGQQVRLYDRSPQRPLIAKDDAALAAAVAAQAAAATAVSTANSAASAASAAQSTASAAATAASNAQTTANAALPSASYTANDVLSKLLGVDGSGCGLDADSIDSIHGDSIVRNDADNQMTAGKFTRWGHANQQDANDGKIGAGIIAEGLNIVGVQTVAGHGRMTKVWGALQTENGTKYWSEDNDGAGGGLDADKLDTYHAVDFLRKGEQSHVFAYRTTALSLDNNAYTTFIFATEVRDTLGEYNQTTGVFTATEPGYYVVQAGVTSDSYAWGAGSEFRINTNDGTLRMMGHRWYAQAAHTGNPISHIGIVVHLAASGTVKVEAYHNQGGAVNSFADGTFNWLTIDRIG